MKKNALVLCGGGGGPLGVARIPGISPVCRFAGAYPQAADVIAALAETIAADRAA